MNPIRLFLVKLGEAEEIRRTLAMGGPEYQEEPGDPEELTESEENLFRLFLEEIEEIRKILATGGPEYQEEPEEPEELGES